MFDGHGFGVGGGLMSLFWIVAIAVMIVGDMKLNSGENRGV